MNILYSPLSTRRDQLLMAVAALLPSLQANAGPTDRAAAFPVGDLDRLRVLGCLTAPLPAALGGLGLGSEPDGAISLEKLLCLLGQGDLSLGQIFEGHVNALRLVCLYGTAAQQHEAAAAARAGELFGLWVNDTKDPLTILGSMGASVLRGQKSFCSAAGHATRALVTAGRDGKAQMLAITIPADRRPRPAEPPQGMRATATGDMVLDGIAVTAEEMIGQPGDYLREPEFSAGAWRTCAAQVGGLTALVTEAVAQLVSRKRDGAPNQLARMGQALIAQETAGLWVRKAALLAETGGEDGERQAYVNLTRIAVEQACLDALRLVQRSLGLAAFVPPNPVERISRDLGTYLRQPAPDEALADAATWFMRHLLPSLEDVA